MDITKLKGHVPDTVLEQLPDTIKKFNINTELRLSHFLSQCDHESGGFMKTKENLNYSEERLLQIFKRDFDLNHDRVISESEKVKAKQIAHNPEKVANFVYANQNGNGDEKSGDGYKFCGRGYIQLTGRINYSSFDKIVEENIIENPGLVGTKYPLMSAAFYFNSNNLWVICDKGSSVDVITQLTKKINGGTNGLDERISLFNKYYKLLK